MRVWYFFGFCCCCISLLKLIGWSYQQKMTPGATGMKWKHILSGILRCVNLSVRYITNKCQKYFSYFVWRFIINIQVIPLAQLDGCVIHLICGRGTCVSNGNTHLRTRPITNTWLETPRISLRVWRCFRISQRKKRLFLQSEDSLDCEKNLGAPTAPQSRPESGERKQKLAMDADSWGKQSRGAYVHGGTDWLPGSHSQQENWRCLLSQVKISPQFQSSRCQARRRSRDTPACRGDPDVKTAR